MNIKRITTPLNDDCINTLKVGDAVSISGYILCGRDAVLPKIVKAVENGKLTEMGVDLCGGAIFHTAVSIAGVGPTSSNKLEIESTIAPLSAAGIKLHLGKGALLLETIEVLNKYNAIYAVMPPITALLGIKTTEQKVVAFPELGMEALHLIKADKYPAIVAVAHGRSIYDQDL